MIHLHSTPLLTGLSALMLTLAVGPSQTQGSSKGPIKTIDEGIAARNQPQEPGQAAPETGERYSEALGIRYPTGPGIRADELRSNAQVILYGT